MGNQKSHFEQHSLKSILAKAVTKNHLMLLKVDQLSSEQFLQWELQLREAKNRNLKGVVLPEISRSGSCSFSLNSQEREIIIPRIDINFSQLIQQKKIQKNLFSQKSLVQFRTQAAAILGKLVKFQTKSSRIHPQNFFFLDHSGQFCFIASVSLPQTSLGKYKFAINNYFSPQQLTQLSNHKMFYRPDQKAQVFSLGITILHASIMESSEDIYDYKLLKINWFLLWKKIGALKGFYSPEFLSVLSWMLKSKPQQRPTFDQLIKVN